MSGRPTIEKDPEYGRIIRHIAMGGEEGISTKQLATVLYGNTRRGRTTEQITSREDLKKTRHHTNRLEKYGLIKVKKKLWRGEKVFVLNYDGIAEKFVELIIYKKYGWGNGLQINYAERPLPPEFIENTLRHYFTRERDYNKSIQEIFERIFNQQVTGTIDFIRYKGDGTITIKGRPNHISFEFLKIYLDYLKNSPDNLQ